MTQISLLEDKKKVSVYACIEDFICHFDEVRIILSVLCEFFIPLNCEQTPPKSARITVNIPKEILEKYAEAKKALYALSKYNKDDNVKKIVANKRLLIKTKFQKLVAIYQKYYG
jgi:hypothetical protein